MNTATARNLLGRLAGAQVVTDLVLAQAVLALGALIINALVARGLGPEGRGEIALLLQVSYVAGVVSVLGRDRSYPLAVAAGTGRTEAARDLTRLLPVPLLLAGVLAVGAAVLIPTSDGAAIIAWGLLLLVTANLSTRGLRAVSIVAGSGRRYLAAMCASQLGMVAAAVGLLMQQVTAPAAWLVAYGVTQVLPAVVALLAAARGSAVSEAGGSLATARRLGYRLFAPGVLELVMARADRLLLPMLSTYRELGLYVVVATFAEVITIPFQQYADSSVPRWAAAHAAGRLRPWCTAGVCLAAVTVGGAVVGLAIHLSVGPLFGASYAPAVVLVPVVVAAACGRAIVLVLAALSTASGRIRLTNAVHALGTGCAVLLCLILIPGRGALGAATALVLGSGLAILLAVAGLAWPAGKGRR
ncbi:lipopolysaccharide biosynthesis protein [Georgenia yuyongxinii]